jgi:hypothetical protein
MVGLLDGKQPVGKFSATGLTEAKDKPATYLTPWLSLTCIDSRYFNS